MTCRTVCTRPVPASELLLIGDPGVLTIGLTDTLLGGV